MLAHAASSLADVIRHNRRILSRSRELNVRAGREVFPVPGETELADMLAPRLAGAARLADVRNLDVLKLPEVDPDLLAEVLRDSPDTLNVLGEDLPVAYVPLGRPRITLNSEMVRAQRWRELPDDGVFTPDGRNVVVVVRDGYSYFEHSLIRNLKAELSARYDRDSLGRSMPPPLPGLLAHRPEKTEKTRAQVLGDLARNAVVKKLSACPLCGQEISIFASSGSCHGPHDARRLLFKEPTCVLAKMVADTGQEIARLTVRKDDGRVIITQSALLQPWTGWNGHDFAEARLEQVREDAIIPRTVTDLGAFFASLQEVQEWHNEVLRLQVEEADLQRATARGEVARLTFKASPSGRSVSEHRGMEYIVPYDAVPYAAPGETWFCRLTTPSQAKPTATPIRKEMPIYADEKAHVAELLASMHAKYGFAPSLD